MKTIQITCMAALLAIVLNSCSVQQFPVNTKTQPFQNGGRLFGERMEKCGKNPWKLAYKKSADIHVLGFNVKSSNIQNMAEELKANSYTIETKSNFIICLITSGMVDYKVVKVIKRDN